MFLIEPWYVYTVLTNQLQTNEIILALKLKTSNINDALSDYNMLSPACNQNVSCIYTGKLERSTKVSDKIKFSYPIW